MNIWIYNSLEEILTGGTRQFTCDNSLIKGGDLIITCVYYSEIENGFLGKVYEVDFVEYNVEDLSFHVVHVSRKEDCGFQGELH